MTEDQTKGFMRLEEDMGRVIPMDVVEELLYKDDLGHMVFLLDDERFKNKAIIIPGLITFKDYEDAEKNIGIYDQHPTCLENSTSKWRLLDIDEMEAFYDFYEKGGMGEYKYTIDPSFEYGTSDLEDVDNPDRSRIYCMDFEMGKTRSLYQYQDKMLMMIRDVSDDDIFQMIKEILERSSFIYFTAIVDMVIKIYPNLKDRIESLGYTEDQYRGSRLIRKISLF